MVGRNVYGKDRPLLHEAIFHTACGWRLAPLQTSQNRHGCRSIQWVFCDGRREISGEGL